MTRALHVLFAACLAASAFLASTVGISTPAAAASPQEPAHAECLSTTLLRIGLGPEALAAADCSAADTTGAIELLDDYLLLDEDALPTADEAWADANQAVDVLKRKIKSGQATAAELASLPGLETTLAAAASTRDDLLAEAYAAAIASLSAGKKAVLLTIKGNASWSLPTHFLAADRTQEDWVALRDALDEERIAAKYSETVSSESQTIISTALGNVDVAAAKVNLEAGLAAVEAAWDAATG